MKTLYNRYKGILSYLFFGVCTTLVNIVIYYICAHWLMFSTVISTGAAWIVAVVFAYITNKLFVFESRSWSGKVIVKEAASFFLCRAATGALDIVIMLLGVDFMGIFDMWVKIISNIVVIILNYIASKWMVFRKEE